MEIESAHASSNLLGTHPLLGTILSLLLIAAADVAKHAEVPIIVMQLFQIAAWSGAVAIAVVTVHGWYKKTFIEKEKGA